MKMATPNYEINYNDQKFLEVEADKQKALNNIDTTYGEMIGSVDEYYNKQIDAAQNWADKQSQLQQERTDFTIEQINQQKEQAHKDYLQEQSGAYVDWQKQSNQYGANAEAMAAQGMAGSGFSESSQVAMYNTYQNRVATARQSYDTAVMNYNNSMKEAQLQNNSVLAEIAYNTLQTQLELSLQGFQYKNDLVISQTNKKLEVENQYYNRYQDVLAQINKENALAEQVRQYNESLLEEQRQFDATQKLKQEQASAESAMYTDLLKALQQESVNPSQNNNKVAQQTVAEIQAEAGKPGTGSFKDSVANKHTENTVYIDGVGEMPWEKLFEFVKAGKVKQSKDKNGKLKYTWVLDKAPAADEEEGGTGEDKDGNSGQPMFIKNHGSVSITKETFPLTITNENGKKQKINIPVWKTADGKKWIFHPVAKEYVAYNTAYSNLTSAYK